MKGNDTRRQTENISHENDLKRTKRGQHLAMRNVKGKQNKEIRLYLDFISPLFDLNLQENEGRRG